MKNYLYKYLSLAIPLATLLLADCGFAAETKAVAVDEAFVCPPSTSIPPTIGIKDVYKDVPFKAGEKAVYLVTWGGAKVGYGTLETRKPIKFEGIWHRVFHIEANTGDWFSDFFVAKEQINAISRPWDFGISSFFMDQNEGKLFSKPFVQKKWLTFDHKNCKVSEKMAEQGKPEKTEVFDLLPGANDSLGAIFNLRSRTFKIGQKERILVYTSKKNWWLEADPVAFEKVTLPAGTFDTVKLKLQTFIGQELQQKGDVFVWIATKTPERQLVQVQGEIKIGSVWIKLDSYTPGK